ncbi:MAG: imidazole glycerol phosphate synthase subunit HisH [Gammaproteobacteria bacterium]|nr:imidazole glycerol phosphate synthase subunit HisH [Gammaproteobacteria bacterium]|tara:strand:- start:1380 stop:1970 length:591 start_codon:yes stop_codon:yes gene_type:complete
MKEIVIIDSGGANIASLVYALKRLKTKSILTTDSEVIKNANRVLLPGVGAAKDAMHRLKSAGLVDVIRNLTQPVLGICLGMQLLCESSEEEDVECIGIIPGVVSKLNASPDKPVPNMGWCSTNIMVKNNIFRNIKNKSFFYYIHSYALPLSQFTIASAKHDEPFSAVIQKNNFFATQFHPERSSDVGSKLLANFLV